MKIIVLHGDHTEDCYRRLQSFIKEAKKRSWAIARINDNGPLSLAEVLTGKSLFEAQALYILENFKNLKTKELEWLKKKAKNIDATLVIYNQGSIPKTVISSLPEPKKIEEFKLPKLIWKFLDSFYLGNAKECLGLLHQVIKSEPEEFVFALLARHLRDLCWAKVGADTIPYPSWRVGKLKLQADKFANGQLKEIISQLAKADIKAKTSKANLSDALDFIIATQLE